MFEKGVVGYDGLTVTFKIFYWLYSPVRGGLAY